jgi:SAM-dependent methyltransferase
MAATLPVPSPPRWVEPINDPDVLGNHHFWSNYAWSQRGEEWSAPWGGTDNLWACSLYPRLRRFLTVDDRNRPTARVLEIGCGFGRITEYLRRSAARTTAVDLTPRCIEACRERFAGDPSVTVLQTSGASLDGIDDGSIDLAFSWDSLVNTSQAAVNGYLRELARVLSPAGAAVLHCSNLGAYADRLGGHEPPAMIAGRRTSQSAEKFRAECRAVGLRCVSQELIPWGSTAMLIDHLSLVQRDPANVNKLPLVVERTDWRHEVASAARIAALYGGG